MSYDDALVGATKLITSYQEVAIEKKIGREAYRILTGSVKPHNGYRLFQVLATTEDRMFGMYQAFGRAFRFRGFMIRETDKRENASTYYLSNGDVKEEYEARNDLDVMSYINETYY